MSVPIFCHAYWRQLKKGNITWDVVREEYRAGVIELAKTDVENGVITEEEFEAIIGIPYTPRNQEE